MLSLIASFIWTNAPIMSAILTILFLIVIRMWSRSSSVIAKPIDKLGEKVVATGTDITNEVSDVLEGFRLLRPLALLLNLFLRPLTLAN